MPEVLTQCYRGGDASLYWLSVTHEDDGEECPLFNCIHSALIDIKNILHHYLLKIPNHLILLHPQSCLSIVAAFSLLRWPLFNVATATSFVMAVVYHDRRASLCRHNIKGKHQWISWVSYFNLFYVNHDIFFNDREKL